MDNKDGIISALKEANKGRQKLINGYVYELLDKWEEIRKLNRYIEVLERYILLMYSPSRN